MDAAGFVTHLTAGSIAGATQLVVGHPFDTVKVKMQAGTAKTDAITVTTKTLRTEGIAGLYRGMMLPLATVAVFNAILFSARGTVNSMLAHSDGSPLTLQDHFMSSMIAGAVVSFVASPTELVKCRLQHQGTYEGALTRWKQWDAGGRLGPQPTVYKGPWDALSHIYRHEGGIRGCCNGLGTTLLRETPGNGLMFVVYEGLKMFLAKWQGLASPTELGSLSLITAGGCAGAAFWSVMYPVDVVKSKLQTQEYGRGLYKGIVDCARKVLQHDGVGGLYRGFWPCLIRAFPANASSFLAYEQAMVLLTSYQSSALIGGGG